MISDNERREVATRLRNNASQDMAWVIPWAVFNDAAEHGAREVMERLADLIEPPRQCPCYDSERHRCSIHDVPTIDRDALLALADEIDRSALEILKTNDLDPNRKRRSMRMERAKDLMAASSRIREALGVTVDDRL